MIITFRIDGESRSIVVFEEVISSHTFGPKSAQNSDFFLDIIVSPQLLGDSQKTKYDSFVY